MKRISILFLAVLLFKLSQAQVSQFPQIYYSGQVGGNSLIRANASLSASTLTTLRGNYNIGAESITSSTESYGTATWAKVCLPSTSSTNNTPNYGYTMYGSYYIRISENNNYAKVNTINDALGVRTCAGCISSRVTIGGQNAYYGKNSILALTGNISSGWYEIYLTNNCSQTTGWVDGQYLTFPSSQSYKIIGGSVTNSPNSAFVWGASINFSGLTSVNTTEGFFQYKVPTNWSGTLTCSHPSYNTSSPTSNSIFANNHYYTNNFVLSNVTPCTGVIITTPPQSQSKTVGNTATFSVVAGGTSPYTYQWKKNGTNISGATSSSYTTPTLTLSDNGNTYSCYLTNCSGNNNTTSNSATLTVTNNPNGTISGNIYVQNISELSGAVVNNTVNTVIRVYNTGSSTSIMNINNSNGIFSISSLQNGNYDIQVEHNYNGHTFKTKRTNVPVNSNLDLYISSYIYQQILNYNAILENIDCYLEDINEYKDIYSYNLQSSNSYINSKITLNNNDLQDNEALLRLAMGERLLIKYLNQAKTMGQEYVMCIDDFAEILFAITKIITCNGSNVTRIPMEFIAERFKDIIKIPINNMNSPHRNLYTTIIDGVFDIATDANISTSTVYNAGIKPIIQRKCINDILSRIYVPNTYHIDNSMVLKSQSYNFSGNLSTTVSNNNYKLSNSLSNTAYIQGFSEGSRNNPDWVVWTRDFFTIAASTTCYRGWFYTVLGLGTNVVQMGILSNAIYKDTKRVNQLIDEVEITTNGSYQRDGIQNNVSKINGIDIIANIVDSFNNEYNLTINELSLNQNNNLYSHLMNLIRINNNLDFYTNEVIKHINAVYPYSNFSDTIYNELLKYTIIGSPLTRLSHLLCLNYYYDNQTEADLRDSIIIHSNDISLTNSNMLIELSTLYPLLDSTNTPGYVAIYENTIPKKMQTNEIKTVNVKFKNYGKSNADDVKIIYTIDEPYHFSIDTLILGTILPDSIISIPVNISSSSFSDTFSLYSVQIESSNANTKHLGGAIFTNSKLTTINSNTSIKKQLSVFPNPNNGSFSIQFETLNNENELSVINNIGQQVYFEKLSNSIGIQTKEIKLNNLPNGIYNIQIKSGRDISIQKIVIN